MLIHLGCFDKVKWRQAGSMVNRNLNLYSYRAVGPLYTMSITSAVCRLII